MILFLFSLTSDKNLRGHISVEIAARIFIYKTYESKYVARTPLLSSQIPTFRLIVIFQPYRSTQPCVFYARPPRPSSTGNHKINPISLNSLNRQALTGIDRCSDGGMWMSHVFSIIYTALLFLSPPLRQVSILLRRNQSVICQTLSIRRLIYVSYCGWLHAKCDTGEENKCGERHSARRQQVFFWFGLFFCRRNASKAGLGFNFCPHRRKAESDARQWIKLGTEPPSWSTQCVTSGVLYHTRGGSRHETFRTCRNLAHFFLILFIYYFGRVALSPTVQKWNT